MRRAKYAGVAGSPGPTAPGERARAGAAGESAVAVPGPREISRKVGTELPGNALAAGAARSFMRAALDEWGARGPLTDDAVLLVSELVTNAVVHAGTSVELECRYASGIVYAEITDRHPARAVTSRDEAGHGHGLRLVSALAKEWGISYRRDRKAVWFQLGPAEEADGFDGLAGPTGADEPPAAPHRYHHHAPPHAPHDGPRLRTAEGTYGETAGETYADSFGEAHQGAFGYPADATARTAHAPRARIGARAHPEWTSNGALAFLAEASDLLAGHTDEDKVASLAGQLMVPRLADWCAVWLEDSERARLPRLARVWHAQESRMEGLREELGKEPPALVPRALPGQAVPWRWPEGAGAEGGSGASAMCRLVVGGRAVGTLVIGRAELSRIPDEVMGLVEDFARRVALAILSARRYTLQATISQVLQRGLLPSEEMCVPGLETALVYEPAGEGAWAGGDFYDLLRLDEDRWRFALGDVCGNGPEAAVVTGLARPVLRLLAREGYSVPETLDRLNREIGEQARFLSLIYGELSFREGAVDCTVACAGHPLPLVRDAAGTVRVAALPQLLLGVLREVTYDSQTFTLHPGDTLLCVTDGVTERRSGRRLFDDGDGLATVLAGCEHLDATDTAERVRRAVHGFAPGPPTDDLAMLVLRAPPHGAQEEPAGR
ncbi:SpoIIE family protein phosphatase [Streptomyces axinellae]|uniref:SpoIIE family protein phosphatase n=1 Tax=Streptomyces axinellae TaxID=552788 RepID=A0ABN3PR20_9ACTN